jgi:hypothetical protein
MKSTTVDFNGLLKNLPWKQSRGSLLRLQVRLYKTSKAYYIAQVESLQNLCKV